MLRRSMGSPSISGRWPRMRIIRGRAQPITDY